MGFKAGLVGLPNVGKSTLFNALTKSSVPAQNYPFCTIDPHVAIAPVPDKYTEKLKASYNSGKIIPTAVTFIDIAGLVKGAASGEGLGNKFLSHIREVDLILHVLRCFEDPDILHSGDTIDPLEDYHIITSELMLKDLDAIEKRKAKIGQLLKKHASNPQEKKMLEAEIELLDQLTDAIDKTDPKKVRDLIDQSSTETIPLLSAKKFLIVANVAEKDIDQNAYKNNQYYQALIEHFGPEIVIPISAKIEGELVQLTDDEAQEMMGLIGLDERGLDKIISTSYDHLGLITFYTCGPKEIHAWPIPRGYTVRQAAGEIHSDIERGFICADVFNAQDLFEHGSIAKLKELGKVRTEGQGYLVQDGDIINVKFNV